MTTLSATSPTEMPSLNELGHDLTQVTPLQRVTALTLPLLAVGGYFLFAALGWWIPALLGIVYFSFVSYGSISHDLVHRNLGLPKWVNEFFLSLIELLAFRSGHAYRLSHLNHHARFPHDDDIEAGDACRSLKAALLHGIIQQPRITLWAVQHARRNRKLILAEALAAAALWLACVISAFWTPIFAIYAVLVIMGSWIFPLVTVYIPHNPDGLNCLSQTRLFRGKALSILAMEHLYHLEHHLYPAVPHQHWPELARRLDPYLQRAGVPAHRLWF